MFNIIVDEDMPEDQIMVVSGGKAMIAIRDDKLSLLVVEEPNRAIIKNIGKGTKGGK